MSFKRIWQETQSQLQNLMTRLRKKKKYLNQNKLKLPSSVSKPPKKNISKINSSPNVFCNTCLSTLSSRWNTTKNSDKSVLKKYRCTLRKPTSQTLTAGLFLISKLKRFTFTPSSINQEPQEGSRFQKILSPPRSKKTKFSTVQTLACLTRLIAWSAQRIACTIWTWTLRKLLNISATTLWLIKLEIKRKTW